MHILHVLDHSIPLHSGYAFRSRAILREQQALGWQTSQLTSSKHYPPGANVEEVDGLRFYRVAPPAPLIARIPFVNQAAVVLGLTTRLAELCRSLRPDIIHAHSPCLVGLAALRVARRSGLPMVYEMRASWEDAAAHHGTTREGSLRYRVSRRLETYVLRRADEVTTICTGLRDDILSRGGVTADKVTVIPNAVDVKRFVARPRDRQLTDRYGLTGRRVLGFAGSFYAYEGLDLLLRAMPQILAVDSDVRLLLVGGGPEESRLKALTRELKLDRQVIFTGRVPHDEIASYYDATDIFVYPRVSSRLTETVTPLKPLEAMAHRRLVVASDVGGHRELIRDRETGLLFRAGSSDALADAALSLLRQPESWAAQQDAGRRFVEQERSWAASVARYRTVYSRVLDRR